MEKIKEMKMDCPLWPDASPSVFTSHAVRSCRCAVSSSVFYLDCERDLTLFVSSSDDRPALCVGNRKINIQSEDLNKILGKLVQNLCSIYGCTNNWWKNSLTSIICSQNQLACLRSNATTLSSEKKLSCFYIDTSFEGGPTNDENEREFIFP